MEYRRSIYEVREEGAQKRFIYLLDEAMGKEGVGTISSLLAEKIIEASCESTFRAVARSVSELSGQSISHTAAWNVVQAMGRKLDAEELQAGKEAAENGGAGELETKVLFEEQDGIWMHLQGKSRKKHGKSKEMKLAIAYDGAQKVGKKRYELTNKVACANFEDVGKFVRRKEGVIARVYNTDEIEMRFLNGDGAAWIRQSQTDESVHFQLDPFHRNKAIRANVKNPEAREQIMELLYAGNIDHLMVYLEALTNSVEDEEEKEHITELWRYFSNNKDGLLPINRRGLNLPEPPASKEYRGMGAMESNIFTILGNRMKGRRACWSIDGGNNIARLLCLKFTGNLKNALKNLADRMLPERCAEELPILMSAKVPTHDGSGYNGYHEATCPPTPQFKWLGALGGLKPLSEL